MGRFSFFKTPLSFLRCNFSDMEIEMFFAKYDADGDGEFSYEEGQKLVEDLDNDMIDLDAPMVGNLEKTADTRALMGPATINHEEFGM